MTDYQFYDQAIALLKEIKSAVQLHSTVPASAPELSNAERSADPSVPSDSRQQQIFELATLAQCHCLGDRPQQANSLLEQIRKLCSDSKTAR